MTALFHPNHALKPIERPRQSFIIDPFAFVLALLGAPCLIAILGFWAFFIPVLGVLFGGPLYLALGTPALLWFLPRYGPHAVQIMALACFANVALCFLIGSAVVLFPNSKTDLADLVPVYLLFGTPLAAFWGLAFAWLYPKFERTAFRALNANFTPR